MINTNELAQIGKEKPRVTIEVSGGMVQNVYTSLETDVDVDILDFDDNVNYGCLDLLHAVERINPRYHLFGHIHAAYGIKKLQQTTFVNSAIINRMYELVNKPVLLEI